MVCGGRLGGGRVSREGSGRWAVGGLRAAWDVSSAYRFLAMSVMVVWVGEVRV